MSHQNKVNELIENMSLELRKESSRLLQCGALDQTQYSEDEYALAKIIITAAMYNKKDDYRPMNEANRKDLKNLLNF